MQFELSTHPILGPAPARAVGPNAAPERGVFEAALGRASSRDETVRLPSDWGEFMPFAPGESAAGQPKLFFDTFGAGFADKLEVIDAKYRKLLPQFGNIQFGPPIGNHDARIEVLRLARAELKVEAMERAGEFDKAVDAFIGINGLKGAITPREKEELKGKLMKLATAALLETEWETAYAGAMKRRIDLSIAGIRGYLLSGDDSVSTRSLGEGMPPRDPDLLGFLKDPKWESLEISLEKVAARANRMLLATKIDDESASARSRDEDAVAARVATARQARAVAGEFDGPTPQASAREAAYRAGKAVAG